MAHYIWRRDWEPKESTKGCTQCFVKHGCVRFAPVNGKASLSQRTTPAPL